MAEEKIRELIQELVVVAKNKNITIQELEKMLEEEYYSFKERKVEPQELYYFREQAESIVAQMSKSFNSARFWNAVEILCIVYEKGIYKRKKIAKELSERKRIEEVEAYNTTCHLIWKFAVYLGHSSSMYTKKNAQIDAEDVLKQMVSYVEESLENN